MTEAQPPAERCAITAKDVFERSNMPSRWERITNVSPKIAEDQRCLAFAAARYLDEPRLPDPDTLVPPDEVDLRETVGLAGALIGVVGFFLIVIGRTVELPVLVVAGGALLATTVAVVVAVWLKTAAAVHGFALFTARCVAAEARLDAEQLEPAYRSVLDKMINCDEGTLAYCAAKIVSEILRDPAWESEQLAIVPIDLFDELAEVAYSARQIADDRAATKRLEANRLRDDPEVKEMITADKQLRCEAIGLLAARVYALADYRDRVLRLGMAAVRERGTTSRARRLAADEIAIDRLR